MKFGATWSVRGRLCLGALPALLTSGTGAVAVAAMAGGSETLVTISGLLTREGVECQALRTDKGELFTLVGNLQGFGPGQRVRVTGQRIEVSTCQQGITVRVNKVVSSK
jgi:hypothetical protein